MRSTRLVLCEMGIGSLAATVIAFVAGACLAAEPASDEASPKSSAETPRQVGLERKLVFTDTENQYPLHYDPDGELPQFRYAATVAMQFRYPRYESRLPPEVVGPRPAFMSGPPDFYGFLGMLPGRYLGAQGYQYQHWLPELVKKMPEASRLPEDLVKELCEIRDQIETTLVSPTSSGGGAFSGLADGRMCRFQVAVHGADKARVKELMRAVVLAIDLGFSPQCHKDLLATTGRLERHTEELQKTLDEHRKQIDAKNKELEGLKSYDDLTPEALASLVAHRRMISVDLAGIEARLEACRKILAPKASDTVTGQLRTQIETVKITAEIELAGLAAKQTAIDEIIATGRHRAELQTEVRLSEREVSKLNSERERVAVVLGEYRVAIAQNWAYPTVGEVSVFKIRWEPKTRKGEGFY